MELSVSILGIKEDLKEKINLLNKLKIDYLHLDIMDGKFVNNVNDNHDVLKDALLHNNKKIDMHLMVEDPIYYINKYKDLNPTYVTFHYEVGNISRIIKLLKDNNIGVGISVNPSTDILLLLPYLKDIDVVLVMTVNPGFGGQKFIDMSSKITELNDIREKNHYTFKIEVDGGINNKTIKKVKADIVAVGSYITKSSNYKERIDKLSE